MCRSWRTWAVAGALVAVVALVAPGVRSTLVPLLVLAACPLSMVVMAIGMKRGARRARPPAGEPDRAPRELVR